MKTFGVWTFYRGRVEYRLRRLNGRYHIESRRISEISFSDPFEDGPDVIEDVKVENWLRQDRSFATAALAMADVLLDPPGAVQPLTRAARAVLCAGTVAVTDITAEADGRYVVHVDAPGRSEAFTVKAVNADVAARFALWRFRCPSVDAANPWLKGDAS